MYTNIYTYIYIHLFSYLIYAWVWLNPWTEHPGHPKKRPRHGLRRSLPVALELLEVRHLWGLYNVLIICTIYYIFFMIVHSNWAQFAHGHPTNCPTNVAMVICGSFTGHCTTSHHVLPAIGSPLSGRNVWVEVPSKGKGTSVSKSWSLPWGSLLFQKFHTSYYVYQEISIIFNNYQYLLGEVRYHTSPFPSRGFPVPLVGAHFGPLRAGRKLETPWRPRPIIR